MTGVEATAADPFLGDVAKTIAHESGGAEAPQKQLLQWVGALHGRSLIAVGFRMAPRPTSDHGQ